MCYTILILRNYARQPKWLLRALLCPITKSEVSLNASYRALDHARLSDMKLRYWNGETLQQIGDHYSITRERVRQILSRAGITRFEGGRSVQTHKNIEQRKKSREEKYMARFGMRPEAYYATPLDARKKYREQRSNARERNIDFLFTFGEWWDLWQRSGLWEQRGLGHGKFVMCRKGDVGPYSPSNVYIASSVQNVHDYYARIHAEAA